ncbi:MAG: hypothetical protein DRR06_17690 [Gammaproteobacteria bacterium]|nr:MAG: hypothetical protein DRR06_17690 [Gammaproteobacteria bacterium]
MQARQRSAAIILLSFFALLGVQIASAADAPKFQLPDNVEVRNVTIWSEGSRLDGDLYLPKGLKPDEKRPVIVMSHGWGGTKLKLQREASRFSAAGYIALTFTYRGWGNSEGKMTLLDGMPKLNKNNEATVKVHFIREVLDPIDWIQDFRSAVDFISGEPHVDPQRIGVWGTSYGGGIVFWSAANDDRISVVVSQVGGLFTPDRHLEPLAKQRATEIAREGVDKLYQDKIENLKGWPNHAKWLQYDPVSMARMIKVPTLLMDAENEQLFDRREAGERAYDIIRADGTTPVRYEVIPKISHWGIYSDGFEQANGLAIEWFDKYLK